MKIYKFFTRKPQLLDHVLNNFSILITICTRGVYFPNSIFPPSTLGMHRIVNLPDIRCFFRISSQICYLSIFYSILILSVKLYIPTYKIKQTCRQDCDMWNIVIMFNIIVSDHSLIFIPQF